MDKEPDDFYLSKWQPSIDHHVTRIGPSIFIGKEHQANHRALSPSGEVHYNLFNL
jgi:hypothetical protein